MPISTVKTVFVLYSVILLEGFVVLASELIAIRQSIPFFGSGTDTIAIIISAVLIPLAFGYYIGGKYRIRRKGRYYPVRKKLIQNILISFPFLIFGLSTLSLHSLYDWVLEYTEYRNRLFLCFVYATAFLVVPVFLLGQTVPLVSQYFQKSHLPRATGKILFISTIGSFLGAVFTTVILMNVIGVSNTVIAVLACLVVILFLLSKRIFSLANIAGLAFFAMAVSLNSPYALDYLNIKHENSYNTFQLDEFGNDKVKIRHLRLNKAYSSTVNIYDHEKKPTRIGQFVHWNFVSALKRAGIKGEVLIIGAGGFTTGLGDDWNTYTYIDIDPDIQKKVEEHFLNRPLQDNQIFINLPARAFLMQNDKKYDLVFFDVARGVTGAPEHLLTREFFQQMKNATKEGGYVVINLFASKTFRDNFTKNIDTTIRSVFPYASRQVLRGLDPWIEQIDYAPVLYFARVEEKEENQVIYTDDKNTSSYDRKMPIPNQ